MILLNRNSIPTIEMVEFIKRQFHKILLNHILHLTPDFNLGYTLYNVNLKLTRHQYLRWYWSCSGILLKNNIKTGVQLRLWLYSRILLNRNSIPTIETVEVIKHLFHKILLNHILHLTPDFNLGYTLYNVNLKLTGTNTYGGNDYIPGYY